MILQAVIEIPFGTNIKYEYDENHNLLRCDRILNTSMSYPGNYGFIPHTLADDNDALDVLVLCDEELLPGSVIKCRPIGYLEMSDEKGRDEKIMAVPTHDVDPSSDNIQCINDIPSIVRQKIKTFSLTDKYKNRFTDMPIEIPKPNNGNKYLLFGN